MKEADERVRDDRARKVTRLHDPLPNHMDLFRPTTGWVAGYLPRHCATGMLNLAQVIEG